MAGPTPSHAASLVKCNSLAWFRLPGFQARGLGVNIRRGRSKERDCSLTTRKTVARSFGDPFSKNAGAARTHEPSMPETARAQGVISGRRRHARLGALAEGPQRFRVRRGLGLGPLGRKDASAGRMTHPVAPFPWGNLRLRSPDEENRQGGRTVGQSYGPRHPRSTSARPVVGRAALQMACAIGAPVNFRFSCNCRTWDQNA